ncbi:MAG: L-threonylcarbamoyladenylate synthase [Bacteroidales bacterium]
MLLNVHPINPDPRQLKIISECLLDGGIVIMPTDTVYGLTCDIKKGKAVDRIARIKGVKKEKANFSFLGENLSQLSEYTKPFPNHIFKLMKQNLPGPFTFILNANSNIPKIFQSKKKTIGIRIPNNKISLEILKTIGNPIMTTSIKDDDSIIEYTTDPELIYEKYNKLVDLVIDGGFGDNQASTIIDCTSDNISILRQGKGKINL